jgi:predicted nuclease of predicted toxin-antitoxin system
MLRLATDADFNGRVYRGLLRAVPDLDIVRAQDGGFRTAQDPDVLAWAAAEGRIVLTHDRRTMTAFAYQRVAAGLSMPGVFVIRNRSNQIGQMVQDILIPVPFSKQHEWKDQVQFLPL